jgi:PAS domain S-box-containing protein
MAESPSTAPLLGFEAHLLDQVPAAVTATDRDGVITHWNRQAEVLFGQTRGEAIGRDFRELLVDRSDLEAATEILAEVLARGLWEGEFPVRRRDGSTVLCHTTLSTIRDAAGEIQGVASVSVDITERKRADQRLAARTAVTRVLADAATLGEATPMILREVCDTLGWDVGAIWTVDKPANVIRCVDVWQQPGVDARRFEEITRETSFPPGRGLPGRVWSDRRPAWIPDVVHDPNFPRGPIAATEGIHGAFGFPIVLAGEVLGVMELFSREIREPDNELLTVMSVIGSQIGQFMERKQAEETLTRSEEELRGSRDQLEAIFQGVSEGITVQDVTGRIIYANEAAAQMIGYPSVEVLLGTPVQEIMKNFVVLSEDGSPLPLEELPGRRALLFGEVSERIILFRVLRTGEERWSWVRASPVLTQHGQVRLAVNIFHDITQERRALESQAFLADASELFAQTLEWEETLRRVAELAVPRLADWCVVSMKQEDGSVAQLLTHHADPSKLRLAEELQERFPPDPHAAQGVPEVIRTGRAELYPEISDELLAQAGQSDEHMVILRGLGLRSAMIVPLKVRGRAIGAITFVSAESGRHYEQADLALAEELARRAAMAVENARLFRERDEIARKLQESLLPPELPFIPEIELASHYHPAGAGFEVGGDFYDVFSMGGGGWGLVIGDVCGKGPDAAGLTGLVRYTIRAAAMQERKPSRILERLNEAVIQQRSDNMFCTVCFVRAKPSASGVRLTVCCGGHPLPFVVRAEGTVEPVGAPGTLLGIFPDPELRDRAFDLNRGDAMVLYTDGVIEEHAPGAVFGTERLASLLESCAGLDAKAIAGSIERAVLGFQPGSPRDDIAILVLRVRP